MTTQKRHLASYRRELVEARGQISYSLRAPGTSPDERTLTPQRGRALFSCGQSAQRPIDVSRPVPRPDAAVLLVLVRARRPVATFRRINLDLSISHGDSLRHSLASGKVLGCFAVLINGDIARGGQF